MITPYICLLKKRNFSLLWMSQVISQFGDRLTQMALIGLVYEIMPASSFTLAKVMSIPLIAVFLVSPVAGVYIDRWDKQKTMYISDFLRGIFILLIPVLMVKFKLMIVLYLLIFLSFCVGRFFIPAKMAIIPSLVEKDKIILANSLISTTAMIAAILGFGVGGIIVEKLGAKMAFFIDSLTFFLSSFLIFFIQPKTRGRFNPHDFIDLGKYAIKKVKESVLVEMKEGIKYLFSTKETLFAAKVLFSLFSILGSLYVVFIVFIQKIFSSKTMDLGYLAVAGGVGLFLGSLIYGRIAKAFFLKRTVSISLILSSVYLIFFVTFLKVYPFRLFAIFSSFSIGLLISPIFIAVNSLIHQESKDIFWGRVFSSLEVVIHFAFLIFMFLSSYLAEKFNPFTIIVSVGIITFLFSVYNFLKND